MVLLYITTFPTAGNQTNALKFCLQSVFAKERGHFYKVSTCNSSPTLCCRMLSQWYLPKEQGWHRTGGRGASGAVVSGCRRVEDAA